MTFLFAGAGVWLLAVIGVGVTAGIRAGQALDREMTPFPWRRADPPGRDLAVRLLRRCVQRAVLGYLRASGPALGLSGLAAVLLSLVLGLTLGWPAVAWGLSLAGVLLAGVSVAGAARVIGRLLSRAENEPEAGGWFFPLGSVGEWFVFSQEDRSELGVSVLEQQKRVQQESLDTAATEVAAVLERVRDRVPEDLRAAVVAQLVLWRSRESGAILSAERVVRQTLSQVDGLLGRLHEELAAGADETEARKFWYTAVLRTLHQSAGSRALAGVMADGDAATRSGTRRRARDREAVFLQESDPDPTPEQVDVIDLRQAEDEPPPEPGSHRLES